MKRFPPNNMLAGCEVEPETDSAQGRIGGSTFSRSEAPLFRCTCMPHAGSPGAVHTHSGTLVITCTLAAKAGR